MGRGSGLRGCWGRQTSAYRTRTRDEEGTVDVTGGDCSWSVGSSSACEGCAKYGYAAAQYERGPRDQRGPFVAPYLVETNIPDPCGSVCARGDDPGAIMAERSIANRSLMLQWWSERLASDGVPDPRGLVTAGGDDAEAVRAERGATYTSLMLKRGAESLTGGGIPHLSGLVCARGNDASAVWAERGAQHRSLMLKRGAESSTGSGIPHSSRMVCARGDDA